jgi:hypothetical protein
MNVHQCYAICTLPLFLIGTQLTSEHCRSQYCMSLLGLSCWSHVQYLEASDISYNANINEPQSAITYRVYYGHGCLKQRTS